MKRRQFITLLGGVAAAWPLAVRAQQPERVRRIGVLVPGGENDPEYQARMAAFNDALRRHGWIVGANLRIDYRWAAGDPGRMNAYAGDLLQLAPDVIFTNGTGATSALQRQTRGIPIVFAVVSDPIGDGFVRSLAQPGGNITGFSTFDPEIGGKWLELLKEISPATTRVGLLFNPKIAPGGGSFFLRPFFDAAARSFAVESISMPVQDTTAIEAAIVGLSTKPNSALVVMPDSFTIAHREVIIGFANRHRLPAVYPFRVFGAGGGLMVYGVDVIDLNRRAATYVDLILKGEKPTDLPVQQPTKFEFVINLKTAKALGIEVPPTLLARADEVIE
jgi:putative tryptophan/tyrosine transport system substrate-binding protein